MGKWTIIIKMGKIIGTNGETTIRIITKIFTNEIIIAFPINKEKNYEDMSFV